LDCKKLTKYGLGIETLGDNKYNRENPKYITGITKYEYLNIPFDCFKYSSETINKLIELYEEVWLISYNSTDAISIKQKYYIDNSKVMEKWCLHSNTYQPESVFKSDSHTSAYITNRITDIITSIIKQFV